MACFTSASLCAGFSPITYSAVSSPRPMASNISVRCQSVPWAGSGAPRALEAPARLVVLHVLEAGELVGQSAHVAAALHVVLAAQRAEARAVAPDVAREQREVDQREDVVDGVVVLGDAERPADDRAIGARVTRDHALDQLRRNPRLARRAVERPRLDGSPVGLDVGRRAPDEERFSRPAARISRPTALARAMSVPTSRLSHPSAHSHEAVRRGSITKSLAPRRTALSTW
jgi:hypothetical protein